MVDHKVELADAYCVRAPHEPLLPKLRLGQIAPDGLRRRVEKSLESNRVGANPLHNRRRGLYFSHFLSPYCLLLSISASSWSRRAVQNLSHCLSHRSASSSGL